MRKIIPTLLLCLFFIGGVSSQAAKQSEDIGWTHVVYMECDTSMLYWGIKNINDMILGTIGNDSTVLVSLHVKEDFTWRYIIEHGTMALDGVVAIEKDGAKDLAKVMKWVAERRPAKHYSLTLWNHGYGILDPCLIEGKNNWKAETYDEEMAFGYCHACASIFEDHSSNHKGMLFDHFNEIYMTNEKMVEGLQTIKRDVLKGKKIDILGTDCCKMAMIEVGYQIKDCVNYLIGSQNCELVDGWNYKDIFSTVTHDMLPGEVVKIMVLKYGEYCSGKADKKVYTLSGLDLAFVDLIVEDINKVSALCRRLLSIKPDFKKTIALARAHCIPICDAPFYTDLDSFYEGLLLELSTMSFKGEAITLVSELKKTLKLGQENIKKIVCANCVGENIQRAKGVSIYFPRVRVDSSYIRTMFAKETDWLPFLSATLQG